MDKQVVNETGGAGEMTPAYFKAYNSASQLESLLTMTYANNGELFRNLDEDTQDTFLWACADLAGRVVLAVEEMRMERHPVSAATD